MLSSAIKQTNSSYLDKLLQTASFRGPNKMEQLLCNRANEASNALAVIDGDHRFTYRDLLAKADILAADLLKKGLGTEEPVGIVVGPGWQQIIARVAVLRAGGTSVPIDPSAPDIQLHAMLGDLSTRFVMTTNNLAGKVSQFNILPIETVLDPEYQTEKHGEINAMSGKSEGHRSHILHTSGSTGKPKAVQISSKAVLHLAASLPVDIGEGDKVGQLNNPGFDLSLFEVWVTLLSGGTVVHIPKSIIKDPVSFAAFLKDTGLTALILPCALFTAVSASTPSAFQSVRHVVSAGESPSPQAMQKVLSSDGPPENLWNGYGPTETTCLSTLQRVTLEEAECGPISAGVPFGDTVLHLLDEAQKPIVDDEIPGEICIGGPGLSAGYLNHTEANAEKFIRIEVADSQDPRRVKITRLYRTGDIGMWKGLPKRLQYIGRVDLQVKHQGFRVELEAIEQTIAANDSIRAVACLHQKAGDGPGLDRLIAVVAPANDMPLDPQKIIEWTQNRHPYYMVPNQVRVVSEIPLNSRGKVDRDALHKEIKESRPLKSTQDNAKDESSLAKVTKILEENLGLSNIGPDDNIISLGLSSLQVARFLGLIKQKIGKLISIKDLYINPSIRSLVHHLHQADETNYGPSEVLQFEADAHLADDIELIPDWTSEGRVFLTGATGFIGVNLLYRWLSRPSMKEVEIACLARGNENYSPMDRIKNALKKYDLWSEDISQEMKRVIVLDGDMTQERLGLPHSDYQWLINWAPAVFHAAAKVNWCDSYNGHFAQNVQGTKNVLRVAAEGRRKTMHYISSIDVWAVTGLILGTDVVSEDGPLKVHLASLPFDTGYAQSQWVADEMVQRVRDKGLPVTIYRPGFVVGDSKTGAGNPDDFFGRLIAGCIQLGYWPHMPHQNQEYVTVDYVCDSIIRIASDNRNIGHAYTLSSPNPGQITNMERLCVLINQAGFSVQEIPYAEWLEKMQAWDGFESSPCLPLMPLLAEPILRGDTRLQTSKYSPRYDCANTLKAIGACDDIRFVQLTPDLVKKYIDFWARKGFYNF